MAITRRLRRLRYSQLFSTNGVNVEAQAKFILPQYIRINGPFTAGRLLWVEAVQQYAGKEYTPSIEIGTGCSMSDCVHVTAIDSVRIGDHVLIGSKVVITDHVHGVYHGPTQSNPRSNPGARVLSSKGPVIICDRVFIGDNCVVQSGVTIGAGTIVAANSVVSKSLPANCIASGAPALPSKIFCDETGMWRKL